MQLASVSKLLTCSAATRTQNKKVSRREGGKGERHGSKTSGRPQSVGWKQTKPSVMEKATPSPIPKSHRSV